MWRRRRDLHLAVTASASDRSMSDLHRRGRDIEDVELLGERFHHHTGIVQIAGQNAVAERPAGGFHPLGPEVSYRGHGPDFDLLLGDCLLYTSDAADD